MTVWQQMQRVVRTGPLGRASRGTPEEIERQLQLPVLGVLERRPRMFANPFMPQLVTVQEPHSRASRAYQALGAQLQRAMRQQAIRTLLVLGPLDAAAQAAIAANLAVTLAQTGQTVVLVDAEVRQPCIRQLLRQRAGAGLATALQVEADAWMQAVVVTGVRHLMVVSGEVRPDGRRPAAGPEAAAPDMTRLRALLQNLQQLGEAVLVNAPAGLTAEACALAAQTDGVLLVVEHNRTLSPATQQATAQLRQAGARVLGAALADMPLDGPPPRSALSLF